MILLGGVILLLDRITFLLGELILLLYGVTMLLTWLLVLDLLLNKDEFYNSRLILLPDGLIPYSQINPPTPE